MGAENSRQEADHAWLPAPPRAPWFRKASSIAEAAQAVASFFVCAPVFRLISAMARLTHLECTRCGQQLSADKPQTICPKDGGVRLLRALRSFRDQKALSREQLCDRQSTRNLRGRSCPKATPVSLGEGFTPADSSREHPAVLIKDEGLNHRIVQSSRALGSHHYGEALRSKKVAIPLCRKRRRCARRICCRRGHRAHLHATKNRHIAKTRSNRNITGLSHSSDDGLILNFFAEWSAAAKRRRLVLRYFHSQRALSRRRQKDHGLRSRRATRIGTRRMESSTDRRRVGLISWKAFDEMEALGWIGRERHLAWSQFNQQAAHQLLKHGMKERRRQMWANAATSAIRSLRVPKAYGDLLICLSCAKAKKASLSL